jgi:hypothetical protein
MNSTLRRALENPRTTIPGLVLIFGGVGMILRNPDILLDPVHLTGPVTAIVSGVSMLYGADAKNIDQGPPPKPQDPPKLL